MRTLLLTPAFLCILAAVGLAAEPEVVPRLDQNDPAALREAIRVLEDEVKLAARPQTYVVIDLVERAILIKGRGVELHRFPIERWSAMHLADVTASFRLLERPPVARRKINPAAGADLPPISLEDMPTEFTLKYAPSLTVTIRSSAPDAFGQWLAFKGREWWTWVKSWSLILTTGSSPPNQPMLQLTVAADHAQSLAWTATDGMTFLVRRPASPAP